MIESFRKKSGLIIREIYFASGEVPSDSKRDIDVYLQSTIPILGSTPFWTSAIDLLQDEEGLMNGLAKSYRQEVRRAVDKDGTSVEVNLTPTIEDIDKFCKFFNEFALFRGLSPANAVKLEVLRNSGNLIFVTAKGGENNLPLGMLSYVSDGYRARILSGSTLSRVENNPPFNQLLSRANKVMHWHAILGLKKAGLSIYDFGGISHSEALKGIDEFKRLFGGVEREEYNAKIGVSLLGKTSLNLSIYIDKFKSTYMK